METINYFAVIVSAASTFVYRRALVFAVAVPEGVDEGERPDGGRPTKRAAPGCIFGLAFLLKVVMAVNLAMFLSGPDTTLAWGATAGALTAVWVALGIGTVALFERRPPAFNGHQWRLLVRLVRRDGHDSRRLALTRAFFVSVSYPTKRASSFALGSLSLVRPLVLGCPRS